MAQFPTQGSMTIFKRGTTAVGQVTSVKAPKIVRQALETTILGSTWKTFIDGVAIESDEIEVGMLLDFSDAGQFGSGGASSFYADVTSGIRVTTGTTYQLVFGSSVAAGTAGITVTFNGVVTGFDMGTHQVNGVVPLTVSIKPAGTITVTTA